MELVSRIRPGADDFLPRAMVRRLVSIADQAAVVVQEHNARWTPGAQFSAHRLREASLQLMRLISSPPPPVAIDGHIAATLTDVRFPPVLAEGVELMVKAWSTYPDFPVSGYDRNEKIDAALKAGDVKGLCAAVSHIVACFSQQLIRSVREETMSRIREWEREWRQRTDEDAARRRKEREEQRPKRRQERFGWQFGHSSNPTITSITSEPNLSFAFDTTPPPQAEQRRRGGDRKSGRSKYDAVFPFYDQLKRKMRDSEVTEAFLIKVINRFRQRRPHLISRVGLTADRKGAERLRSALKRRSPKTTVVNATKNAKPSDESKVVSTDKSTI